MSRKTGQGASGRRQGTPHLQHLQLREAKRECVYLPMQLIFGGDARNGEGGKSQIMQILRVTATGGSALHLSKVEGNDIRLPSAALGSHFANPR